MTTGGRPGLRAITGENGLNVGRWKYPRSEAKWFWKNTWPFKTGFYWPIIDTDLPSMLFGRLDWKPPGSPWKFKESVDRINSITTVTFYELPSCVIVVYFIRRVRPARDPERCRVNMRLVRYCVRRCTGPTRNGARSRCWTWTGMKRELLQTSWIRPDRWPPTPSGATCFGAIRRLSAASNASIWTENTGNHARAIHRDTSGT